MLTVAVTEPLDPHHSRGVTLNHHAARWTAVAGISIAHYEASGNWTAADHDFC